MYICIYENVCMYYAHENSAGTLTQIFQRTMMSSSRHEVLFVCAYILYCLYVHCAHTYIFTYMFVCICWFSSCSYINIALHIWKHSRNNRFRWWCVAARRGYALCWVFKKTNFLFHFFFFFFSFMSGHSTFFLKYVRCDETARTKLHFFHSCT